MSDNPYAVSLLSQATGYGVVVGLGVLFALVILVAVRLQRDYLDEDSGESEMFMVANRTVGTGLTCSAVFSSWMWINETVFSAVQCYKFGIAAPVWFGSGVAFQISLMAVLGVLVKLRVPNAHTSLEIVRIRYGKLGHWTFIFLNLINNIVGCASMIVTGSQLLVGLTGINIAAATVLIPLGVVLYTAVGGLKATFLTDFLHTAIALILIIYLTISVLTHQHVGGFSGLYNQLLATAGENIVPDNYAGSLLTFKSKGAIIFGIILKFGNLALVIMDTAFWQKSFAAEVRATVPGYNLAALSIFAVPWGLGTVMGLTARAFQRTDAYPFLSDGFSEAQVNAGYVMPYTIYAFLGSAGSVGMLLLLFMAVTSTVSSSMIAVSSILSYDMYRTYINPKATDKQIVRASHLGVIFHGAFITGITLALNYAGANINWLSYSMNMVKCPGVIVLMFTILWRRQSKLAAVLSPVMGLASGLTVWLVTTRVMYGEISMTTTAMQYPALYGTLTSTFTPGIYSIIISYLGPKEEFDWSNFLSIQLVTDGEKAGGSVPEQTQSEGTPNQLAEKKGEESEASPSSLSDAKSETSQHERRPHVKFTATDPDVEENRAGSDSAIDSISPALALSPGRPDPSKVDPSNVQVVHPFDAKTIAYLYRWYKIAWGCLAFIVIITFVAWPLPLYRNWIFPQSFFTSWVTAAIVWQFFALSTVVIYPVYDGRRAIFKTVRGLKREWSKRREAK